MLWQPVAAGDNTSTCPSTPVTVGDTQQYQIMVPPNIPTNTTTTTNTYHTLCAVRQYDSGGTLLNEVQIPSPTQVVNVAPFPPMDNSALPPMAQHNSDGTPYLGGSQHYSIAGFAGVGHSAVFVRNYCGRPAWGDGRSIDWIISQDVGIWDNTGNITWTTLPDIAQYTFVSGIGSTGAVWTTNPVQTGVKLAFPTGADLVVVGGRVYVPTSDGHLRRII